MSHLYAKPYSPKTDVITRRYTEKTKNNTTPMEKRSWIREEEEIAESIRKPKSETAGTEITRSSALDALADTLLPYSMTSSPNSKLEKNMCSYCHKRINHEPKMILNDMMIICHASCFKCEVCNRSLEHLKAGDSMWVYRQVVHCESCFNSVMENWH